MLQVAAVDGLSLVLGVWIGLAEAEFAPFFTSFQYEPLAKNFGILKQLYINQ